MGRVLAFPGLLIVLFVCLNFFMGEIYPFSPVAMFTENRKYDTYYFVTDLEGKPVPLKTVFNETSNNLKKLYRVRWRKFIKGKDEFQVKNEVTAKLSKLVRPMNDWQKAYEERRSLFDSEYQAYVDSQLLPFDHETALYILNKLKSEGRSHELKDLAGLQLRRGFVTIDNHQVIRKNYVLAEIRI